MDHQEEQNKHDHVYVIIRLDTFDGTQVASSDYFAVKMVVWTKETAEREVNRLNELNRHKGAVYLWRYARLEPRQMPEWQATADNREGL